MKRKDSYFIFGRTVRRRHSRCLIKFIAVFLLVMMALGIGTGGLLSCANAGGQDESATETSGKYYTSIRITEGASLYTIAGEYITKEYADTESYVNEVMQMNALNDETIHSGRFLIIPYYSKDRK